MATIRERVLACIKQAGEKGILARDICAKIGKRIAVSESLTVSAPVYTEQEGKSVRYFYMGDNKMVTYILVPDMGKIPHRQQTREAKGMKELLLYLNCAESRAREVLKKGLSQNGYYVDILDEKLTCTGE